VSIEARKIRLIMQLRRSGVTDTAILSVIERVPRELFVPPAFQDQAYEDQAGADEAAEVRPLSR